MNQPSTAGAFNRANNAADGMTRPAHGVSRVTIDSLAVTIDNAAGHEHRIGAIAARAADIFAQRLSDRLDGSARPWTRKSIEGLPHVPLFDLGLMSDEEAARQIASAWLDAVAPKLNR
jgi:hypothetical protein